MIRTNTHSMTKAGVWSGCWEMLRPGLLFVTAVSGLVGLALSQHRDLGALAAAFFALVLAYVFGVAAVGALGVDGRRCPAPSGSESRAGGARRVAPAVAAGGLVLCALVLALLSPWTLVIAALAVSGIVIHPAVAQRRWAGAIWAAWIVALVPAIGFVAVVPDGGASLWSPMVVAVTASVFFSVAVLTMLGQLQGAVSWPERGGMTRPERLGWSRTVQLVSVVAFAGLAASAYVVSRSGLAAREIEPWVVLAWSLWLAGAALLAAGAGLTLVSGRRAEAERGKGWVIRGFVLLHLGEGVAFLPALAWPCLGLYALFELVAATRAGRSWT